MCSFSPAVQRAIDAALPEWAGVANFASSSRGHASGSGGTVQAARPPGVPGVQAPAWRGLAWGGSSWGGSALTTSSTHAAGINPVSLSTPAAGEPHPSPPPKLSRSEQARINGAKSKGPTSEAGKATSSQNALKHGLCAKGLLVPGEDPAEYQAFVADYRSELCAVGTVQTMLAERAAEMAWKLKRIPVIEAVALETSRKSRGEEDLGLGGMGDLISELLSDDDVTMQRLARYETRIERSMRACLRELRELQGSGRYRERGRSWERGRPTRIGEAESGRDGRAPSNAEERDVGRKVGGFVQSNRDLTSGLPGRDIGFVPPDDVACGAGFPACPTRNTDGQPEKPESHRSETQVGFVLSKDARGCGAGGPPARGRNGRVTDVQAINVRSGSFG